jgi:two-component system sensor histidine kinase PilS (NtrC family)
MNAEAILYSSLLLIAVMISFYLVRLFGRFYRTKKEPGQKDASKVSFVVDTFHELVSKLKDKEKELEDLRRKAEDRATAIEGYNENILQSVPSGVISFDEDMKIAKVNTTAEKILEINGEAILGKHQQDVFDKPIATLINEKKMIERGEILYITPSGKRIWLGLTLSPLKDSKGKIIGRILVFTDLTHLKAIESQMELRDKLSSLGEISAGIAHELRNPMGVIAGYTKLLSKKADISLKPTVEAISKEILVMDRIISDFLSFAKPAELLLTDIDLKTIIENCVTSVTAGRSDIKINSFTNTIPPVKGDEVFLRQAFINLVQNSVEAMAQGGELNISASAGNSVVISISDTGHGISDNIKDKIFLPFFTTKEKGTGLGLAIVHKIIVSHGGSIAVESSEKGTTFRLRFPLEQSLEKH